MLSRKCKYALMAVLHIAERDGQGASRIAEVSREEGLPRKFLESILTELKNAGILISRRGKNGGYQLARPAGQITIGEIVRLMDGPIAPSPCSSEQQAVPCLECRNADTCGLREIMIETRDAAKWVLDRTTIAAILRRTESLRAESNTSLMFFI